MKHLQAALVIITLSILPSISYAQPVKRCLNLVAHDFAQSLGMTSCGDRYTNFGHLCHNRNVNKCAKLLARFPFPPGAGAGNMTAEYTWMCPNGAPNCGRRRKALCADGTRPSFYYDPGGPGSNEWLIYFSGGGSCIGTDCVDEYKFGTAGEMSTCIGGGLCIPMQQASFAAQASNAGVLSGNPAANQFSNYHRISIRKCTFDGYRGNSDEKKVQVSGAGSDRVKFLHHHGHRTFKLMIDQLAAGVVPGLPSMANATTVVLVGNSGGGLTLSMTGDELRDHIVSHAPGVKVRFVIDAHTQPMIQLEGLINASHVPVPVGATNLYDVPWGGSGILPLDINSLQPAYSAANFMGPSGRVFERFDVYDMPLDASCEAAHGARAPECHDDMHVLLNHVTTPFFLHMDQRDPDLRDKPPAYTAEESYDWVNMNYSARVRNVAIDYLDHYATLSELATGVDTSGTPGTDQNDLQPAFWNRAVFVPDCGSPGMHTSLIDGNLYGNVFQGYIPPVGPAVQSNVNFAMFAFVLNGTGVDAVTGYTRPTGGTWSTTTNCP